MQDAAHLLLAVAAVVLDILWPVVTLRLMGRKESDPTLLQETGTITGPDILRQELSSSGFVSCSAYQ